MNEMLKRYAEETLAKVIAEQPLEQRLKWFTDEEFSVQDLVKALSPEKREALRRELEKDRSAKK